jgi:NAD(P)-dependent dehydrogenase (short-subunit alcohol dehydrogenase family)
MKSEEESPRRVAIVTGCAKEDGIGRAIADLLSADHRVFVTDISPSGLANQHDDASKEPGDWAGLESVVAAIEARGGEAAHAFGDITKPKDCTRMVGEAIERFGRVDVLVNNAGAPQGKDVGEIDEVPIDVWDRMMEINVRGVFLMTRAVVPYMREQKWGRIVSIASIAGLIGRPRHAAYSASKAAVLGLTKSLAIDLAPHGVTVNAVCPGSVLTSRAYAAARRSGASDVEVAVVNRGKEIPVGRHALPQDIASAVGFFASEAAVYVTGQALAADGGEFRV